MTALSQVEQDRQSAVGRDSGKRAFRAHPVSVGSNHNGFSLWRLDLKCCGFTSIRKVKCLQEDVRFTLPAELTCWKIN